MDLLVRQTFFSLVLEVFLRLGVDVESVREGHPLDTIDEFLRVLIALLLVRNDARVDVNVVNSKRRMLRQLLSVAVIQYNFSIRFKSLGPFQVCSKVVLAF